MRTDFFEKFAAEFSRRRLDLAARRFNYPSAFYLGGATKVYRTQAELGAALDAYHARLNLFDYSRTRAKVVCMTPKRGDKQIVWVDWCHFDGSGDEIERTTVKYFCKNAHEGSFKIQLAEYIDPPCIPVSDDADPEHSHTTLLLH
ncbi:hypothetical protein AAFO92_21535 [Roseovarius sp. CAU 1744]|uniref:hypothetical protein n=1 Tax=Roseovarius sp. CAU 1744 TaxID=3140368 RepID=UPI00325BBF84